MPVLNSISIIVHNYGGSGVGWVDIGTRARVPLRFVVYLKKSRENDKKLIFSSKHFSVGPGHTVHRTPYKAGNFFVNI
jgi:hypothetical protein